MKQTEFRVFETRAEVDKSTRKIVGYASTFNQRSNIIPHGNSGFIEQVMPQAFDRSLAAQPNVMARYNHSDDYLLGTTQAGTLRLSKDENGLRYEVDVPNTSYGNDLIELMSRGDINKSSFAFRCNDDKWELDNETGLPLRTLTDVDLIDVAPVNRPAYNSTTAQVRSEIPSSCPSEFRSMMDGDMSTDSEDNTDDACTCPCDSCMNGDCSDCTCEDCDCDGCTCTEAEEQNSLDKPTDDEKKYIQHKEGNKNSKGEDAPWVITQKGTGKVISSFATKEEAYTQFANMVAAKNSQNSLEVSELEERVINARIYLATKILDVNSKK